MAVKGVFRRMKVHDQSPELWRTSGELNIPLNALVDQTLTVGAEWSRDELDDPSSTSLTVDDSDIGGISGSAADRSSKNHSQISALYIEDNIEPVPGTNIIPGLRFDYLNESGGNFSPSLNLSQELGDYFKVKAGLPEPLKHQTCINPAKVICSTRKATVVQKILHRAAAT